MVVHAPYRELLGDRRLIPVILGGDIGGYSLARAFHEAFGVRSIVMSVSLNGVVRDSSIIINHVEPHMDDPDQAVASLLAIADDHPDGTLLAVASADWLVRILVERRDELEHRYIIPYVDKPLLDLVTSKVSFAALCEEYSLPHPQTVVVNLDTDLPVDTGTLRFPVIAKAGDSGDYHAVSFAGKEKVFTVASREDLDALLERIRDAGFTGSFVIQDLIPGDDAGLRINNTYVDTAGKVSFTVFGHVLLQEHTPSTVGNSSVVLTAEDNTTVAKIHRLLEGIGWRGCASLDMKVDPRTGETVFFELNPRLSRSNYFATGSGCNPALAYVREYVLGLPPVDESETVTAQPHLFTVVPKALVMRYIIDRDIRAQVGSLYRRGAVTNPLWNRAERHPRRWFYVLANQINQVRKYRTYYPRSTQLAERRSIELLGSQGADGSATTLKG